MYHNIFVLCCKKIRRSFSPNTFATLYYIGAIEPLLPDRPESSIDSGL